MDVAARAYRLMMRVRAGNGASRVVEHPPRRFDWSSLERPAGASSGLHSCHSKELFAECLAGYPSSADRWFTFHKGNGATPPAAAAMVRGGADRVATLFSLSRESSLPLSGMMPSFAGALHRAGYHRLSVSTLTGTQFARELTQAGFVQRADSLPMMVCPVTELGADVLRAIDEWEITELDCDPYIESSAGR
jgi:hypothetical protein